MSRNQRIGAALDEMLAEDGVLAKAEAAGPERVIAWQVSRGMTNGKSKPEIARAMKKRRAG